MKGEGPGAELVRVIRKIAQVKRRLLSVDTTIEELKKCDLHRLKVQVEEAEDDGKDLLNEMAARLEIKIREAEERLTALSREGRGE